MDKETGLYPFTENRASLSKWLVELHNLVNDRKGKNRHEYENVRREYENSLHLCKNVKNLSLMQNYFRKGGARLKLHMTLNWVLAAIVLVCLASLIMMHMYQCGKA